MKLRHFQNKSQLKQSIQDALSGKREKVARKRKELLAILLSLTVIYLMFL